MTVHTAKAISVLGAVAATLATGTALADGHGRGHYRPDYVYARVVDVDPVVRYVTVDRPEQRCWNESAARPVAFGVAGQTAAGGFIGATIGHILGHGDAPGLTLAGAAAGAVIAHENAVRNGADVVETRANVVRRCETVSHPFTERQIDGYRVTYVLDGRRYTTHTDYRPGDRIQVAVDARPVGRWGG